MTEKEKFFNQLLLDLKKNFGIENEEQLRKSLKENPLNIAVFTNQL